MSALGFRHNGGPPLDDGAAAAEPPRLPADAACLCCVHWHPPSEREESDHRAWQGGYGHPVREPSGHCFRVMHRQGGPTAFAGTMGRNRCFNFERKPDPDPAQCRTPGVTIWQNGKIIWEGSEGEEPAEFQQGDLDLRAPGRRRELEGRQNLIDLAT